MCAPALGAVGALAGVAGSAVSAMGQKQQAEAQANSMAHNASVARINARSERQKGYVEQEDIGAKADKARGEGIAAAGASGVDPYYGSAALVIFGEGKYAETIDKDRAFVNAEGAAVNQENKARDLDAQAAATRKAGKMAAMGTFLGGLGGAIGSFGKMGGGGLPALGGGEA